jgi:hypothetical protein
MVSKGTENVADYLKNISPSHGLEPFIDNTQKTKVETVLINGTKITKYINEFWTAKQRQASSIHEISYRGCFKPQLPRFFIKLLTHKNDTIYDPFSGRGTTVLEAGLLGRNIISNDINPLSEILASPRFHIPTLVEIENRLSHIPFDKTLKADIDLSMFYHPDTEAQIVSLRNYLIKQTMSGKEDYIDKWIRMIATNRLTGHSAGFFSVYTLPPNQALSPERQIKINQARNQKPDYRNTKAIIIKKSESLLRKVTEEEKETLKKVGNTAVFLQKDARITPEIRSGSIQLTVTSPPFLDVVQYSKDNWLRCWFNSINLEEVSQRITMARTVEKWTAFMADVFKELFRVTQHGGWVAFEVGEVKKGAIKLEEYIVPLGLKAGFQCEGVLINLQEFTKTSNIWGISNNDYGTNTNRIVLFKKEE